MTVEHREPENGASVYGLAPDKQHIECSFSVPVFECITFRRWLHPVC